MRVIFLRFAFFTFWALAAASCAAPETPQLSASTVTPAPTATRVWFPATDTPAAQSFPSPAATAEMKPNVGAEILRDDFSAPSDWQLATADEGSAAIRAGRLTLAAQGGFYLFTLRRETLLDDFYAEITAEPNLCRDMDSYGLLMRVNSGAAYRIALTCNGSVSAEKSSGRAKESLQKPTPSGDAPLGAGKVRMGIWAQEKEARIFLNDRYQFSINASAYRMGGLGVFVNAAADNPIIVSFSHLVVWKLTQP